MNPNLVTYQTLESPRKTTGTIVGVSLLVLGIGAIVTYLVLQSRKPDEAVFEPDPEKGVKGLLDDLSAFGSGVLKPKDNTSASNGSSSSASQSSGGVMGSGTDRGDVPVDFGCNSTFNKIQDVIEIPDGINRANINSKLNAANINKCGRSVLEFQTYVSDSTGINMPLDGKYGSQTKKAHKEWLIKQNLV